MYLDELRTELVTDPKGLGYAVNLESTNDVANAALINLRTGPGAATILLQLPQPGLTRMGSRAEVLFGAGASVHWLDIFEIRTSPLFLDPKAEVLRRLQDD